MINSSKRKIKMENQKKKAEHNILTYQEKVKFPTTKKSREHRTTPCQKVTKDNHNKIQSWLQREDIDDNQKDSITQE